MKLTKFDRFKVFFRSHFLQSSWNYERMQNSGWCYGMIPAIKRLYSSKDDQIAAYKRHMVFFNTHPYAASPIFGVILSMEEDKANGEDISDADINGAKTGMMGPLAGVADPVFWFALRPILAALGAFLALQESVFGPILFFVLWSGFRQCFKWMSLEYGYKKGRSIIDTVSPSFLQKVNLAASITGMFFFGVLACRAIDACVKWDPVQKAVDTYFPGIIGLGLTLICYYLLKKEKSIIGLLMGVILIGVLLSFAGILV